MGGNNPTSNNFFYQWIVIELSFSNEGFETLVASEIMDVCATPRTQFFPVTRKNKSEKLCDQLCSAYHGESSKYNRKKSMKNFRKLTIKRRIPLIVKKKTRIPPIKFDFWSRNVGRNVFFAFFKKRKEAKSQRKAGGIKFKQKTSQNVFCWKNRCWKNPFFWKIFFVFFENLFVLKQIL